MISGSSVFINASLSGVRQITGYCFALSSTYSRNCNSLNICRNLGTVRSLNTAYSGFLSRFFAQDLLTLSAVHNIDHRRCPVIPVQCIQTPQDCLRLLCDIYLFKLCLTVQTVSTIRTALFPEIIQNILSQTL